MKFGTIITKHVDGDQTVRDIDKYRNGEVEHALRHYKWRVKVANSQAEMEEYLRFTEDIARFHQLGTLAFDKDDPSTKPCFIIEYPKENVDGAYFVIKSYCLIAT